MSGGKAELLGRVKVAEINGRMQALGAMLGSKNQEVALLSECIGSFVTASQSVVDRFAMLVVDEAEVDEMLEDEEYKKKAVNAVKATGASISGDAKLDAFICQLADVLFKFTRQPIEEEKIAAAGGPKVELKKPAGAEAPGDGPSTVDGAAGHDDPEEGEGDGVRSRTVFPAGDKPKVEVAGS